MKATIHSIDLRQMMREGKSPADLGALLAEAMFGPDTSSASKPRPATIEEIQAEHLMPNSQPFQSGDRITLAEHAKGKYRFPQPGETVIVTRTFPAQHSGKPGTPDEGHPVDIAVGISIPCNKPDCEGEVHVFEYLYDSRHFVLAPATAATE